MELVGAADSCVCGDSGDWIGKETGDDGDVIFYTDGERNCFE